MKTRILKLLREKNNFISGQILCDQLGVSRTAVWKTIKQLQEDGYKIEAVTNKGYRFLSSPDLVTKEEIESQLETKWLGQTITYKEVVDSTNTEAKRVAEEGRIDINGLVVVAEQQSNGKGRRGKNWCSPKQSGIWMTLALKPTISPIYASMLTLVAAMAVASGIEEKTDIVCKIKWPNDVIVNNKKICGILTEMSAESDFINYVVIGIGVNVNNPYFPEELKEIATSLFIEKNHTIKRAPLIANILKHFEFYYELFLKTEDLTYLVEDYNKKLISIEKQVNILEGQQNYEAISKGINKKGELLIEGMDKDNKKYKRTIIAGQVSVRGLYGYI